MRESQRSKIRKRLCARSIYVFIPSLLRTSECKMNMHWTSRLQGHIKELFNNRFVGATRRLSSMWVMPPTARALCQNPTPWHRIIKHVFWEWPKGGSVKEVDCRLWPVTSFLVHRFVSMVRLEPHKVFHVFVSFDCKVRFLTLDTTIFTFLLKFAPL